MEIISHRGYWKLIEEKNKILAFQRSFSMGFGTETDIRDYNGALVISHDIPSGDEMSLDDFFELYNSSNCQGTLALNIKSDGLHKQMLYSLEKNNINNYVVFDMSVPDSLGYLNYGVNILSRFSEYETENALWSKSEGIWFDSFEGNNLDFSMISKVVNSNLRAFIVSPELHAREHLTLWAELKAYLHTCQNNRQIVLCTDIPEDARVYFDD
jgi:glycerophosphoryl diester phosphodiesterase